MLRLFRLLLMESSSGKRDEDVWGGEERPCCSVVVEWKTLGG